MVTVFCQYCAFCKNDKEATEIVMLSDSETSVGDCITLHVELACRLVQRYNRFFAAFRMATLSWYSGTTDSSLSLRMTRLIKKGVSS